MIISIEMFESFFMCVGLVVVYVVSAVAIKRYNVWQANRNVSEEAKKISGEAW
jgi:hypothetical protein